MTMKQFVSMFENPRCKEFNEEFITASNDYSLEELTVLCMKEYEAI